LKKWKVTVPIRRSLDELIARLTLEKGAYDVVVEGPSDRVIVTAFLQLGRRHSATVLTSADIEVPARLQTETEHQQGARGRVLSIARVIDSRFKGEDVPLLCIVDRDFDDLVPPPHDYGPLVVSTDYCSMDLYSYDPSVVERVLSGYAQLPPGEAARVLAALEPVLTEVYLIRAADHRLGLRLGHLSPERCCRVERGTILFDRDDYLNRCLDRHGLRTEREAMSQAIESLRPDLPTDSRLRIHGHDFVYLLAWYLRQHSVDQRVASPEVIGRVLRSHLDLEGLAQERLFGQLLDTIPEG
jgi:hypothetical protein